MKFLNSQEYQKTFPGFSHLYQINLSLNKKVAGLYYKYLHKIILKFAEIKEKKYFLG